MAAPSRHFVRKFGLVHGLIYREPALCLSNQVNPRQRNSRYLSTSDATLPDIITPQKIFLDTNAVVTNLEESGFQREQAVCLTGVLVTILSKEAEVKYNELVTKEQKEIMMQQILAHIAAIRKDMIILEKSEFSSLKNENDKLQTDIVQLKQKLKDEIQNLRNNVTLDINLERSRAKDLNAEHDQIMRNNDHRITTEVANMMARLEATKNDLLKYFAGILLGSITIGLGFYRVIAK